MAFRRVKIIGVRMGPAKETRMSLRRRNVLFAVIVSGIVVVSAIVIWVVVLPKSLNEVYGYDHIRPGSQATIRGTITSIVRETTTYGPRVYLGLDGSPRCSGNVLGDPNSTYQVGQVFQTTLHFESYTINGDAAVWAPELACPFPIDFEAIGVVVDAISQVGGITLIYNGTSGNGLFHYDIVTHDGDPYRPDTLPVFLRKSLPIQGSNPRLPAGQPVDSAARWTELSGIQYLGVVGAYSEFPVVDQLGSLAQGTSPKGMLKFVDVNGNGLVDGGDRLDVNLSATGSPTAWDSYLLLIGRSISPGDTYVFGTHFFLNGPRGPFEIPEASRTNPLLDLRYAGDQIGAQITSRVDATRVRVGAAPGFPSVRFLLGVDNAYANGTLSGLPATLSNGASLSVRDANSNGLLDAGDFFLVGNLTNHTSVSLTLSLGNAVIGSAFWVVGYGKIVGRLPAISLMTQGVNPWRMTANVSWWSPELALNRSVRVSLRENGATVIANASLVNGTVGTFANGTLSFTDLDGDGTFSNGDFLTLAARSGNAYRVELSVLYRISATAYL
jgi:hypothetical protein